MARHRATPPAYPPADARACAWEILQRVESGSYADALLGHRLDASGPHPRDRALVTRLVYGTLAWQGYLDHIIAAFSRRPPTELDPPVRTLLRLAVFQICFLTRIPDFAAVDTAVELGKRFRGGAAASLVNAVLRRAAAGWRAVQLPPCQEDPIGHLSIRLSHPRWLVERWVEECGFEEAQALLRANNEVAPTVLRVNRCKTDRGGLLARLHDAGCEAAPTAYSPAGIRVAPGGAPDQVPGYREGLFSVQGEASQLVAHLVGAHSGARVLDACAAPGGKTTHLAELMNNKGEIVALDANAQGVERITRMAHRLGLSIVRAAVADATRWDGACGSPFDCVLVDAPCSGLGTLRAHPEVKWRSGPEDIAALARLQRQLLAHVSRFVRPGGTLVYATCTLTREENDGVLGAFLRDAENFAVEDPRALLPESARPLVGAGHVLRSLPHRHELDGFFAVRLRRW